MLCKMLVRDDSGELHTTLFEFRAKDTLRFQLQPTFHISHSHDLFSSLLKLEK